MQYVFPTTNLKRYRFPTHVNDLVVDRSESSASEVFVVDLEPGEAPPLHKHDDTEQVFYVLEGEGVLTVGEDSRQCKVMRGDVVRIPLSTLHSIRAEGRGALRYLAVDCFGAGRNPEEPTWDDHVRALCRANGWEYDKVTGAASR